MTSSSLIQPIHFETMIIQGVPTQVRVCSIKKLPQSFFLKFIAKKILVAAQFNKNSKQLSLQDNFNQKKQTKQNELIDDIQSIVRFKRIKKNRYQKNVNDTIRFI